MLFEELQVDVMSSPDVEFLDSDRTSTPAWLIRLACAAHAGAASLAECRDLCEWFGVERPEPRSNTGTKLTPTITTKTSQQNQTVLRLMKNRSNSKMSRKRGSTLPLTEK